MDDSTDLGFGADVVPPVFGSAGPMTKTVDLDEIFSELLVMEGDSEGSRAPARATEDVLATSGAGAGAGAGAGVGLRASSGGSRAIGIGLGMAAGAAQVQEDRGIVGTGQDIEQTGDGARPGAGAGEGVGVGAGVGAGMGGILGKRGSLDLAAGGARTGIGLGLGLGLGLGPGMGAAGVRAGVRSMSEQQKMERRERNREHAKRSRIRKKFMLECLQEQLLTMRKQNMALRQVVKEHMPNQAPAVFEKCISEKALALSGKGNDSASPSVAAGGEEETAKEPNCLLIEPDFQLMQALMESQQNFTVSDPSMPDNPIVYASQGFLTLTGYSMQNVIGRNCRFLQGPGTDPRAIDIIRQGVADGRQDYYCTVDTSVCLLNYKADGTPFWNQFFVAALRDDQGKASMECVVNFVGVQCEVKEELAQDFSEKLRKIPLPEELMRDGAGAGGGECEG
ncbi:unnamed protein product [Discosporangium mesarthrocarpum]